MSEFAGAEHDPGGALRQGGPQDRRDAPYLAAQAATGRSGVAAIGVAQEFQNVFASSRRQAHNGVPWFSFTKADRRVTCFYFYLWDADFGPAFIKVCAYFPYPVKVWVNGHEWAKRQATQAGIGFTELSNGFATCDDPAGLQAICDRLGPGTIEVFFERWMSRLPLPLTGPTGRPGTGGSCRCARSRCRARSCSTHRATPADSSRRSWPTTSTLAVPTAWSSSSTGPRPHAQPPAGRVAKTTVVTRDTEVTVNAFFKHSRVKQYLKDGRALRIETVVNSPDDLGCQRRLRNLDDLQTRARDVNRRLLDAERVGQGCVLASPAFERVAQPTVTEEGRRAPALRFGDPRVMALVGALCACVLAVTGFTNRSLRARVTALLGGAYSMNQTSYDLARLRLNGLITRIPRRNRYLLTPDGQRVRDLLHQGPRPAAAPPARRRPAARSAADTKRLAHHRYSHHKMHRQRQTVTSSSLKTQDNSQCPSDKGSLGVRYTIVNRWP